MFQSTKLALKGSPAASQNAANSIEMNATLAEDMRDFRSLVRELEGRFETLMGEERFFVLTKLLSLVDEPLNDHKPLVVSSPEYRRDAARTVRENEGLSREKLSPLVGLHHMTIYKMEVGSAAFRIDKRNHRKYLDWLCSHGYKTNPKA